MPDYKLPKEADTWFKKLDNEGPFKTKFDYFYMCCLMGFAEGHPAKAVGAPGFVDHFVQEYKSVERLMIGLLLDTELRKVGCSYNDKKAVQRILSDLVSGSGLSQAGIERLNEYAAGGYEKLIEQYQYAPYSYETFLPKYVEILHEITKE